MPKARKRTAICLFIASHYAKAGAQGRCAFARSLPMRVTWRGLEQAIVGIGFRRVPVAHRQQAAIDERIHRRLDTDFLANPDHCAVLQRNHAGVLSDHGAHCLCCPWNPPCLDADQNGVDLYHFSWLIGGVSARQSKRSCRLEQDKRSSPRFAMLDRKYAVCVVAYADHLEYPARNIA